MNTINKVKINTTFLSITVVVCYNYLYKTMEILLYS